MNLADIDPSGNEGRKVNVQLGNNRGEGVYSPKKFGDEGGRISLNQPRYSKGESHWANESAAQGLMHELGHATADYQNALPPDRPNISPSQALAEHRGRDEAFADDYAQAHWRDDPRNVSKGREVGPPIGYESDPKSFAKYFGPYNWDKVPPAETAYKTYMASRKVFPAKERSTLEDRWRDEGDQEEMYFG